MYQKWRRRKCRTCVRACKRAQTQRQMQKEMCRVCVSVCLFVLLHKSESENEPIKCKRNGLQKQTQDCKKKRKKSLCVRRRGKNDEHIWTSNSNNKSLQVNEVDCILRLAKLCAPRDWNVNTCSFLLSLSAFSPSAFMIVFFLSSHCLVCFNFFHFFSPLKRWDILILLATAIINRLKAISWSYVKPQRTTKNRVQKISRQRRRMTICLSVKCNVAKAWASCCHLIMPGFVSLFFLHFIMRVQRVYSLSFFRAFSVHLNERQ